ncbi:ABC transporter permease subunit [Catenibacillus scindens]|uniref:ABC transporter permease subunit n=1 Tax=Catenibacillus scindens TaxID=673271 RepID=UPI00320A24AD
METKKKKTLLPVQGKILWDVIILSILSVLCFLLPFAHYTYHRVQWTVSGLQFITGTSVQDGEVVIASQWLLIAFIAAAVLSIVFALVFPKIKKIRLAGFLIILGGILELLFSVLFTMQVQYIMADARNAGTSYAAWLLALIAVITIARGFHILYKNKVLSPLDFMIMPGCIYFLINNYFPLVGIFIAFKRVDYSVGIMNSEWVGFSNFTYLFSSSDAWVMTRNTILYNVAFIILGNLLGIIVGIFLSEVFSKKLQKLYQTTILLPQLISIIIVAYIVFAFLSNEAGLINKGILGEGNEINFYNTKIYWPFILTFVNLWKGLGYNSIIYLSAIVSIDKSLYEAAYVDGANRWQQITRITVPLLKPSIITLVTMSIGRIFYSDFGLFYQVPMDSGALYSVTQTIDTYVYRSLLQLNNIAMASAASAYQSVVGFVVVLVANGIVRKIDNENAMF